MSVPCIPHNLSEHQFFYHQSYVESEKIAKNLSTLVVNISGVDCNKFDYSNKFPSVRGGLQRCKEWWYNNLNLSKFVVNILECGYEIPFVKEPPRVYLNNNTSASSNPEFVIQAITELMRADCVMECDKIPYCYNPLSVVPGKKKRLVIDLSCSVNPFVEYHKFKYENLSTLAEMFEFSYRFFTFDIKSAYYHIDMHPKSRKYFGFSFT